jgi:hypothetical protein
MENQTRFDLNAAIEGWQRELAAQPNLTSDDRRELEAHMRDAMAELQHRGLPGEEAFWLARRRVGQPHQLGEEYVKADPAKIWRERTFWMALAALVLTLADTSVGCVFSFLINGFVNHIFNPYFTVERYRLIFVGFRLLFYWLPISVCVWMVASGRLAFNSTRLGEFLHSRRHLGMAATAWMLINMGLQFVESWRFSVRSPTAFLASDFLSQLQPLLLLALMVWLVHTQTPRTPRPV